MTKYTHLAIGVMLFLGIHALESNNKSQRCGIRSLNIIDTKTNNSQFGEFPWMTAILREEPAEGSQENLLIYQCGASLIHPQAVLTAAHCVTTRKDKKYRIRAGEWDTQSKNESLPHQDIAVKNVIIHHDYQPSKLHNDVAILILDSPVKIADNVNTICLPEKETFVENTKCYASGWGKNASGGKTKYSEVMKKVELPLISKKVCEEKLRSSRLGKGFQLHSSFICAGGEGVDTCNGDGGSPLVCPIPYHPDRYYQIGIVSWGTGCGEDGFPGAYSHVTVFKDWIKEQLTKL